MLTNSGKGFAKKKKKKGRGEKKVIAANVVLKGQIGITHNRVRRYWSYRKKQKPNTEKGNDTERHRWGKKKKIDEERGGGEGAFYRKAM